MKRGKDDEKILGPMFPRLHVNDTEKGGPRAPPRNKMALYEQLSVPCQRFNPGLLPLNSTKTSNLVPPASSSQGSDREKGMFFSLHLHPSTNPAEKTHANFTDLNTPAVQREPEKKLDEEDFRVPIFLHSGMGHNHNKHSSSIDKEPKRASITGFKLRQQGRNQSDESSKDIVAAREQAVKSASNLSANKKTDDLLKQTITRSIQECKKQPEYNFTKIQKTDASLQQLYRAGSQPGNIACSDGNLNQPLRGTENGTSSISGRDLCPEEQRSPYNNINDGENLEERTYGPLQTENVDRSDDISETSMVDSVSGFDISPDDVVGIIGRKHFWKARRAIVNQQRVFAVQVFELHRLIKVQKLIAGSPHLLVEDDAFLGRPLKSSPAKKLPLNYIVKPPLNVVKHKDEVEKPNHKMECSAENAVGKTSLSSVQNVCRPSNNSSVSGNMPPTPLTTKTKMGPLSFHQPVGHQWLIPVLSPSEGLIYKPYPRPAFMGLACGDCGPHGSTPLMGNNLNPSCGVPASHHHYQGFGFPSGGHNYFPPYGMSVMNPTISDSAVEQMNHFAGSHGHSGQLLGAEANFNVQHQSSSNVPHYDELQGSTASSPGEREPIRAGHTIEERNVLPFLPTTPDIHQPEGAFQPRETHQPTRVIKVVPHNARSATESAARIFQSIQEERKQH
ncbi:protein EARLY FLOWERING 3-like [Cornus florida]|uniref:protein EARLY FLOWERING 3-like n=1 Tax=Cornus florida TaxID=4283 RepID=UPI00289B8572|nr:protein EARLY FLOWERING 3-like [Cornus florida]